jgi:hypothetical protein
LPPVAAKSIHLSLGFVVYPNQANGILDGIIIYNIFVSSLKLNSPGRIYFWQVIKNQPPNYLGAGDEDRR